MWLLPMNEFIVLFGVLAVGLAVILLIRRFPGFKPKGQKKANVKRESELGPVHHHRDDHHLDDRHV
jgi:hypothetical protein